MNFLFALGVSLICLACGGDPLTAPADANPINLYAQLTLEHKGILLSTHAPYNTVQLRAVARNLRGDTLSVGGTVKYRRINLADTSVAVDSATGVVTVRKSTTSTRVEARLTVGGVTRADTATIVVRNTLPVQTIARMEFFPLSPDSNWRWAGVQNAIGYESWVRLFDTNGDTMANSQIPIVYSWNNGLVVVGTNSLTFGTPAVIGETYIRARLYAYGTSFSDSVLFRRVTPSLKFVVIGREFSATGEPRHRFYPDSVDVKPGTTVVFMNANGELGVVTALFICNTNFCGNRLMHKQTFLNTTLEWVDSTDVVFDHPELVSTGQTFGSVFFSGHPSAFSWPADGGSGDIPAFGLMRCVRVTTPHNGCGGRMSTAANTTTLDVGYRSRRFNTVGTYRFHSTRFAGASGVIVVK